MLSVKGTSPTLKSASAEHLEGQLQKHGTGGIGNGTFSQAATGEKGVGSPGEHHIARPPYYMRIRNIYCKNCSYPVD
jgi:hypothetical protein